MRQLDHGAGVRGSLKIRRATVVLAVAAGVGLVASALLGAPLVSILLVGLLLICPLLLWVPFRFERRALDASPGREDHRD